METPAFASYEPVETSYSWTATKNVSSGRLWKPAAALTALVSIALLAFCSGGLATPAKHMRRVVAGSATHMARHSEAADLQLYDDKAVSSNSLNSTEVDASETITLLQFNPHWECFKDANYHKCGLQVFQLITRFLQEHDVDFANLVMFAKWYSPPDGWGMKCWSGGGGDTDCIIWKSKSWEQISPKVDCWYGHGRACNVMTFQRLDRPDDKVTVVGAHFPHAPGGKWYGDYLGELRQSSSLATQTVTKRVIVLADSNAGLKQMPDRTLLEGIGALSQGQTFHGLWYAYRTCCYDMGYQGFFDRIAANFGQKLEVVKDSDYRRQSQNYLHAPAFAQVTKPGTVSPGAFHHPVLARLTL
eukprot:TRINITY_DN20311_c0_g1_i1.p1 TRINITY_DN20311_c0_g1~~TRINITY_DN20311_c0_g1_i1.p1  ORF type:complete len:358 (-),score=44.91 TRINITY_DN20311_c0_g1_i1:473-1546(-)